MTLEELEKISIETLEAEVALREQWLSSAIERGASQAGIDDYRSELRVARDRLDSRRWLETHPRGAQP